MPPVRAESSTVSIPPREKRLAKRNEKARRQKASSGPPGPPNPPGLSNGAKRKAKRLQPVLTLAGQRQRRTNEVAYISRPDGIHIKRVVRRSPAPELPLVVPYLPGQEDLPHSDDEHDPIDSTVLEISTIPTQDGGVNMDANMDVDTETEIEGGTDDKELWDYDAEGEVVDEDTATDDASHAIHPFLAGWATHPSTGDNSTSSYNAPNPLADATNGDVAALLGSLGDLHFATNNPVPPVGCALPNGLDLSYSLGSELMAEQGIDIPFVSSGTGGPVMQDHTWVGSSHTHSPDHSPNSVDNQAQPQHSIDLMPPPRLPRTEIQTFSSPATPVPRLTRRDTPNPFVPQTRTPTASNRPLAPASSHSRLSTRDLVAQTRAQIRTLVPASAPSSGLMPDNDDDDDDDTPHTLLRPTPLRVSLSLPEFLHEPIDPNEPRLTLPVRFEDTDIGLNASSPRQYSQPHTIASEFGNINILSNNPTNLHTLQAPTLLELKINAIMQLKISSRNHRGRHATQASPGGSINTGSLTSDQRRVLAPMEYHILKQVVCTNPWPSDRDLCLLAAVDYAMAMTTIRDSEVYTPRFLDTAYSKTSANRGSALTRVEFMVEHSLGLLSKEKHKIMQLLQHDQVFFPTGDRNPGEYFCVKLISDVLEIIFFKSGKLIGLVFMEELCMPDDPVKCARWHKKLRDPTATRGVPPAAIAFAAAQIYWALEKMYLGTRLNFDEQHFRPIWERYFRAVLKLPHLGALRLALLDRLKLYYMDHWPAEERDEDDESFTAW